jgi:PAS domain S-box-containing protein
MTQQVSSVMQDINTFKLVVDSAPVHIVVTDPQGVILYANNAVSVMTGYSVAECVGNRPSIWGGQMTRSFYDRMWAIIKKGDIFEGKVLNRKKDGTNYVAVLRITPLLRNGEVIGYIGVEQDVERVNELELTGLLEGEVDSPSKK